MLIAPDKKKSPEAKSKKEKPGRIHLVNKLEVHTPHHQSKLKAELKSHPLCYWSANPTTNITSPSTIGSSRYRHGRLSPCYGYWPNNLLRQVLSVHYFSVHHFPNHHFSIWLSIRFDSICLFLRLFGIKPFQFELHLLFNPRLQFRAISKIEQNLEPDEERRKEDRLNWVILSPPRTQSAPPLATSTREEGGRGVNKYSWRPLLEHAMSNKLHNPTRKMQTKRPPVRRRAICAC